MARHHQFGRGAALAGLVLALTVLGASPAWSAEVTFGPQVRLGGLVYCYGDNLDPVDLDGDGDLDLVTRSQSQYDGNRLVWLENGGATATTCTAHAIAQRGMTARDQAWADLDNDGDIDLVSNGGNLTWHENNGAKPPVFTHHVILEERITPLYAADLNKDGKVDLLFGRPTSKTVVWLENRGGANPTFVEHPLSVAALPERCVEFAAADLDKDGDLDPIISCEGDSGQMCYWLENDGAATPSFTLHAIDLEKSGRITPGDIDRDGRTDLLIGRAWYRNDKATTVSFTRHLLSGLSESTLADFDGDGDLDILGLLLSTGLVRWFENDGLKPVPGFVMHDIVKITGSYAYNRYLDGVAACDLDRDGDIDPLLIYTNYGVLWYPNQRLAPKPLALFKPNGGEKFKPGQKVRVDWRAEVATAGTAARVELWRATAAKTATLLERATASAANGVGSNWVTIPTVATRNDYRMRLVSLKDARYTDFSDGPFTITRPNAAEPVSWVFYE